jgi:hypothetical protein
MSSINMLLVVSPRENVRDPVLQCAAAITTSHSGDDNWFAANAANSGFAVFNAAQL